MSKLTKYQAEELNRLAGQKTVDTSDIPEVGDWDGAERGRFYRPVKKQVTLRIDADVISWFKSRGDKYQTKINAALREYIEQHRQ
jgi:uncharacterized protein (DUF4415 family)